MHTCCQAKLQLHRGGCLVPHPGKQITKECCDGCHSPMCAQHFQAHIAHLARHLRGCCTVAGNFFFAGARTFFNSLEAAIFLFSRVARIPEGSSVMPVISTEERITLGAVLDNGSIIKGQNQISHPSVPGQWQYVDSSLTLHTFVGAYFTHS